MNHKSLLVIPIIVFFTASNVVASQRLVNDADIQRIKSELSVLKQKNANLSTEISKSNKKYDNQKIQIQELKSKVETLQEQVKSSEINLSAKIKTVADVAAENKVDIVTKSNNLTGALNKNKNIGFILFLIAIIASLIAYVILSKRQSKDKTDVLRSLKESQTKIEEELVAEFSKHSEKLENQTLAMSQLNKNSTSQIDHSLALKVADEITLIERNINLMDQTVKGIKQLRNSVSKLKDNLSANGYDIPELLGKTYHEGMKLIITSSIEADSVESGSEVITKIIKPQVNFNEVMIQAAQVEITIGV